VSKGENAAGAGGSKSDAGSAERLRHLQAISEAALAHLEFERLVDVLLTRVRDILGADTAAVLLLDENGTELVARGAKGLEEEVERGTRVPLGKGFAGRIAAERRPIYLPDVDHADVVNPLLREKGVKSMLGVPLTVEGEVRGVLHVGTLVPHTFTGEDTELLQLAGDRIALAIDHARMYEAQRSARVAAEMAIEELRRLEAVTSTALAHLSVDAMLNELLARLHDVLGIERAVALVLDEETQELAPRASIGIDPEDLGAPVRLGEGISGRAAVEGRPVWLEPGDPVARSQAGEVGLQTLLAVPLLVEGRVLGVLSAGSTADRALSVRDSVLLERAADRIAIGLDHARLIEAERAARAEAERAVERVHQIESITEVALAHLALDDDLLVGLLTRVRDVLVVDTAAILLLDIETDELVARAARGLEEEVEQGVRIPMGKGFAGRIAASRKPVVIDDVDHADVLNPILREKGIKSMLGVPLLVDDVVIGVMHVGSLAPRDFTRDDETLLQMAGDRIAVAIHHARLYEREHVVAETLQRSLLPEVLPEVQGIEMAARYVPGATEADVGGDWYDVLRLTTGSVALVIGDVVSRGLRAAAVMGQLRNALRAYLLDGHPPGAVLERVDRVVRALDKREMATLLVVELDPHSLELRFASAGHPPPVVIGVDGEVELLEGGRSAPLGVRPEATFEEGTARLQPGTTLLLYTDGLVERRDMWIDEGIGALIDEVRAAHPLAPGDLCDRLLASLLPGDRGADDVALLAVLAGGHAGPRLVLTLPAETSALAVMRRAFEPWLVGFGATEDDAYDILVAMTEAAANSAEHAYGPVEAQFEVEAEAHEGEVTVVIRDFGLWRAPRGRNRGRGTLLMHELMDSCDVVTGDEGTEVRMSRRLGRVAV
jgi:GAF domain-containing protein/anti-sigma regulatory factor (Ser/Thr protein kinase)